jgi:hypothetical protein
VPTMKSCEAYLKLKVLTAVVLWTYATFAGQGAPIPSLHELITNCPSVVELVMRYRAGGQPDELYLVRSQSNAFLLRATREPSFATKFDFRDTLCGFWDDEYWSYELTLPPVEGPPPIRSLRRYYYDPQDTVSAAFSSVGEYVRRFGLFTSAGIAIGGRPDLVHQNAEGHFLYHSPDGRFSISAVFDPGDPAPAGATLRVADKERGVEYADYVSYRYRPDIADGRLPSSIHFSEHHSIEVLAITFGATSSALPKEAFMPPPELLALDRLSHVVESNRTLYRVLSDGRLAALEARSAERQLRSGPSAARGPVQWIFIGTFAGLSLILVLWLKRKQQP